MGSLPFDLVTPPKIFFLISHPKNFQKTLPLLHQDHSKQNSETFSHPQHFNLAPPNGNPWIRQKYSHVEDKTKITVLNSEIRSLINKTSRTAVF